MTMSQNDSCSGDPRTRRLKYSPYIAWAKRHHNVRFNLASSGVTPPKSESLGATLLDFELDSDHEDGWAPLRHAIASRYGVHDGNIVLTQGASMSNHLVCSLLLEPGDHVLVEIPYYEPLVLLPRLFHAEVDFVDRSEFGGFGIDWRQLEDRLRPTTRLLLLSDLHNPSGARLSGSDTAKLVEVAEAHNLHVLVDEVYLEWLWGDQAVRSAAMSSERLLATSSLTKAYGLDAIRLGWIVAEAELARRLRRLVDLFSVKISHASERLGLRAFEQASNLLSAPQALVSRNRTLIEEFVASNDRLSWAPGVAAPLAWIKHDGISADRLYAELEKQETAVAPGHFFGSGRHFRLGFGMDTALLQEGLHRLAASLRLAER